MLLYFFCNFFWVCFFGKREIELNSFYYIGGYRKEFFFYRKCFIEIVFNGI